jgi:DNA-directed RNA polymerase subunit K/omega
MEKRTTKNRTKTGAKGLSADEIKRKTREGESESSEIRYILDNDYRKILKGYDSSKNRTRPIISIYERTLLIGKRATQIAYGADPLIKVADGMTEVDIAEEELRQRLIPFIIERRIGDNIEYWRPADMILV